MMLAKSKQLRNIMQKSQVMDNINHTKQNSVIESSSRASCVLLTTCLRYSSFHTQPKLLSAIKENGFLSCVPV
jgi:hypothetical protein